ncbi:carbohydrate-binding module 48 family protein [Pseudomonas fluorescens]|uniref:Carbohydrate-binding module 48 family protein n=1 Tax=Pseudomonas fluorescens TaxID=294 RepID=A0A0P8WZQ2_PSEFL|nr:carboxypeptidase-like regulatory domain-containing protein [Pseudomonas fluorescens]KPU58724.1 carbohydrate-binding module 48 family protein [Pseudomonas fluorescens]
MTAKPPNTSALTPTPPIEATAQVTFDEVLDSSGNPVGKNSVTYDKTLRFRGTAGATRALWIRDGLKQLTDVTSNDSGIWIKHFTLPDLKRYSLNAIEKSVPYDFSPQYTFVLATETPIIETVTGKDGPIENGGTYDGDSLEFSGYAPPNMEVEAFNGDTSTGKKATVNGDGLFKLTFDGLTAGTYSIKIRAANGKESSAFTFRVVLDVKLILNQVSDSQRVIPEGGTTYDDKVTVRGYARPGEDVQLRNNDTAIDGATATAREDDGLWEIELEVSPSSYSLTVQALYGEGEISEPPYAFTVVVDVKLSLDDVADSKTSIPEGGTTYDEKVTVSGYARPGRRVQLLNNGVPIGGAITPAREDDGFWEIELDVTPRSYSLTVEALYGDGEISTPPRTFTVALDVKLSLDDVADSKGSIPEDGTTYDDKVTVSGYARPGEEVQLRNNDVPVSGAKATAREDDGYWEIEIDVTPASYSLTVEALYGDGEISTPPRTFTVALDVKLSLDDVLESADGPSVPENGTTDKNQLIIKGHARPGESIQLLNGGAPIKDAIATADPDDGAWEILLDVTDGAYSLAAKANYGDGEITAPPRTFTVASIIQPHNTHVYDSDGLIEDNGKTSYNQVFVRGDAAPLAAIRLKINGVIDPTPEPTDDTGKWVRFVRNLNYETTYRFIAVADYGDNAESNPWTITTEALDVKPVIECVKDSNGNAVLEGGYTADKSLRFIGKASPHHTVEVWNGNQQMPGTTADEKGDWSRQYDLSPGFYNITIKVKDIESSPPRTFYVVENSELIIDKVTDENGVPIPNYGSVSHRKLIHFYGSGAYQNSGLKLYVDDVFAGRGTADESGGFRINTGSLSMGGPYRFQVRGVNEQVSQDWYIRIT